MKQKNLLLFKSIFFTIYKYYKLALVVVAKEIANRKITNYDTDITLANYRFYEAGDNGLESVKRKYDLLKIAICDDKKVDVSIDTFDILITKV